MTIEKIKEVFQKKDFDIRKTNNARFMDQKVTPDVLSIVSDCILEYIKNADTNIFTSINIREQDYSNNYVKSIFNKPGIENDNTSNEYDKFFQQPLKMLSYAGILSENSKTRPIVFSVEEEEILKFISLSERNALTFIQAYLEKVLIESNIFSKFEFFFKSQSEQNFKSLKEYYEKFIISNTPICGNVEVRRIFTKILNPLSFKYKSLGTRSGRLSKSKIQFDELMYNRVNFRDMNKEKNITRNEAAIGENSETYLNSRTYGKFEAYANYSLQKARKIIYSLSEYSEIDNKIAEAYHIHHIYPKNEFPEFSAYIENLIKLTPNQHLGEAHPKGKTDLVNYFFQKKCIITKVDKIHSYLLKGDIEYYSKESLIELLNGCLFIDEAINYKVFMEDNFSSIKAKIVRAYEEKTIMWGE